MNTVHKITTLKKHLSLYTMSVMKFTLLSINYSKTK